MQLQPELRQPIAKISPKPPRILGRYCKIRSYLVSARNHGVEAIDAIHTALAGNPWLPTITGTAT